LANFYQHFPNCVFFLGHLTENTVEATLQYRATTLKQQLPYGLQINHTKLCTLIQKDGGKPGTEYPTHVVSEITYGLNAYMQFTKTYRFVTI
jgi:hypothetical protein